MDTHDPTPYIAVIGDLVQSRESLDRLGVQRRFAHALRRINRRHAAAIAAQFRILTGDECEGLLATHAPVYAILREIESGVGAGRIRFGVGCGTLALSPREFRNVGMLDGPAFHAARAALRLAREARTRECPVLAQVSGFARDGPANTILALLGVALGRMTPRRRQVYDTYRREGTIDRAARHLGVHRSTVGKALARQAYHHLLAAEATVAELLRPRPLTVVPTVCDSPTESRAASESAACR